MALLLGKTKFLISTGKSRGFSTISFSKCGVPAEVLKSGPSSSSTESVAVGTVKVAIKASAVQVEDVRAIRGLSLMSRKAGVAGTAGSGVVTDVAVGEGQFSTQDSVLVLGEGVWSDEVTASKDHVIKVTGLSHEELASLPSFLTAWGLLHNFAKLNAGDVVVQTSGSTAVGSAVAQLGKALGLKVVSLADSDVKGTNLAAKLQEVGAYKLAICGQSGRHVSSLQRHVARGGATVAYNGVYEPIHSAADVQLPISHMIFHDSSVYGFDLLAWARAAPADLKHGAASVLALAKEQKLSLKPAQVLPQADFLKAIEEVSKTGAAVVLKH